jgi:DNA-3-methyladenine glycosylase I
LLLFLALVSRPGADTKDVFDELLRFRKSCPGIDTLPDWQTSEVSPNYGVLKSWARRLCRESAKIFPMTTYCDYCNAHPEDIYNRSYHDTQYGFPLTTDNLLFERMILEINQAGLSWITILKKAEHFRDAYDGFDIDRIAAYGETDRQRLLTDAGVIRNRLKVNAAIENARRIQGLREQSGSFKGWLDVHHPQTLDGWCRLFKKTFVFTGGEIVNEFLMSSGYLPGAHTPDCPVYGQILELDPPWVKA